MAGDLFRGALVRLAALEAGDLADVARWYGAPGFGRLFDATPARPRTAAQLRAWWEQAQGSPTDFLFAVRTLDGDRLVGMTHLDGIIWNQRVASLAIAIGTPGQGYGRDALSLTLGFAFDELNLHRVQLTVFAYNTRAVRLYERAGFHREGVMREFLERDGRRYDMYVYGLLRHEWARERPAAPPPLA